MSGYILSVDCGTQSLRAVLFSADGNIIDMEKVGYRPYVSNAPAEAEQDPDIYLNALISACRKLSAGNRKVWPSLAGIGIATIRDTPVFVDMNLRPVRPAIVWLDERKTPPYYRPSGPMGSVIRLIGMAEALKITGMDGKTNWVRYFEPDVWEKTDKVLMVSGYLNAKLTGEFRDSLASQIGHIPFDFKRRRWARPGERNMQIFPIEQEKLPMLAEPGETLGRVTKAAAALTGLPAGLSVIACASDKGCETIGMGILDHRSACLSFGSAATVQTTTDRYFEPIRFLPSYPAALPGYYNPEIQIYRGYWMITWFKNEFGHKETLAAEEAGVMPELLLNDLLKEVPPGSMGLMVQPYWKPLLKRPNQKGAIIGFGDVHTRAHIYRAVIEGLAYALLDGLHQIETRGRTHIHDLAAAGGASQSDEICQIAADVFNRPIYRGKTHESTALGAAAIVAAGTGLYPDIMTAAKSMSNRGRVFEPDVKHAEVYHELFHTVYKKMQHTLYPLNRQIRKITNYPAIV
ncbi:MAG: FGGY-family carbohydrate kinase [Spirochaetales bacterium]|nr:FGGY-family carbohydrate kinase [Spirochaetales bacterium]